jgi:hypothetical protein
VGEAVVKAPYFVVEGNDVAAYANYDAIEKHLEPIDVERGAYRLFDATGTEMNLSVVRGRVKVGHPIGSDAGFLKQTLTTYLTAVESEWGIDIAHLSEVGLAGAAAAFTGRIRGL